MIKINHTIGKKLLVMICRTVSMHRIGIELLLEYGMLTNYADVLLLRTTGHHNILYPYIGCFVILQIFKFFF